MEIVRPWLEGVPNARSSPCTVWKKFLVRPWLTWLLTGNRWGGFSMRWPLKCPRRTDRESAWNNNHGNKRACRLLSRWRQKPNWLLTYKTFVWRMGSSSHSDTPISYDVFEHKYPNPSDDDWSSATDANGKDGNVLQASLADEALGNVKYFAEYLSSEFLSCHVCSKPLLKLSHACVTPSPFERQEDTLWGSHLKLMTNKKPYSKLPKKSLIRNTTLYTHGPIAKSILPKVEERSQPKG